MQDSSPIPSSAQGRPTGPTEDTKPLVSIIANFHRSAPYIPRLVKSVLRQTYADWELVCVNDCSPLDDAAIVRRFAARDSRIRLIDLPQNVGISRAKQEGIRASRGEYLTFIDGDDWLDPLALEKLMEPVLANPGLDIVVMNAWRVVRIAGMGFRKELRSAPTGGFGKVVDMETRRWDCLRHFYGQYVFGSAYWGKLFSRRLVEETRYEPRDNPIGEDYLFNFEAMRRARRVCFVDFPGYFWQWGGLSTAAGKSVVLSATDRKFLQASNDYFIYLETFIPEGTEYDHIRRTHREELVSNLLHTFAQIASPSPGTPDAARLVEEIAEILRSHRSYAALRDLEHLSPGFYRSAPVQAILSASATDIYALAYARHRASSTRDTLKRLLYRLLSR